MAQQPTYILAIIFSTITLFIVWLAYKFLVPMWFLVVTPTAAQYPAMVGNNPTYVNGFNTITANLTILYNYSFAVIGLAIVGVFVVIIAYRTVFGQQGAGFVEESI